MIALIRYEGATMLHSQRYLAPVLLFMALVGAFSSNSPGPLAPLYGTCAGGLLVCSAWLASALVSAEAPAHRPITVVAAGRSGRVLSAIVLVAVVSCCLLTCAGLVLPLIIARHGASPADLLVGAAAQLTCALTGTAIGLVCSRLVFRRPGFGLVLAVALIGVVALVPGVPPANSLFRLLAGTSNSASVAVRTGGYLILSAVVLLVSTGVTHWIAVRRD